MSVHSSFRSNIATSVVAMLIVFSNILLGDKLASGNSLPREKIKGMAFTSGHDLWAYRQPFARESLRRLKRTGVKYVHITTIHGMNTTTSRSSFTVTDDASAVYVIRLVHSFGFRIFLKPIVQTRHFIWRGFIPPSRHFFRVIYTPFIVRMARIAARERVALFSVGSELERTVRVKSEWVRIIRRVRRVYKGPITYVANHDSYHFATLWHLVDCISISGYFRLIPPGNKFKTPNLDETRKLWLRKAAEVDTWRRRSNLSHLKVLIAEAGAMSKGNNIAYIRPWAYNSKGPTDLNAQAKIYEGLLNAFMTQQWCKGVILYSWDARPNAGRTLPSLRDYTPQGKPALKIMKKYFKAKY